MLNEAYLLSLQPAVLEAVLEAVLDTDRLNVDIQNALQKAQILLNRVVITCLLYTSPSPRDRTRSRMPSSA